jgi:hypothetical protein
MEVSMASIPMATPKLNADRAFFSGMALLLLLLAFAGFAQSYFLAHWYGTKALTPILHLHGLVTTAWILFFLAQTTFVATKRVEVHRRIGMVGLILAGAVPATSLATAMTTLGQGRLNKSMPVETFLIFPIGLSLMFLLLVGLAAYNVREPQVHKRLMLMATIAAIATPVARLKLPILPAGPIGGNLGIIPLIGMLGLYDKMALGRLHPATLWSGAFVILMLPGRLLFARTEFWHNFIHWLGA